MASQLYLVHHGIKGQRWGVRRFQNKDGSLTAAGKDRYTSETINAHVHKSHRDKLVQKYESNGLTQKEAEQKADKRRKIEKAIAIGAAVTATALVTYGAYRYVKSGGGLSSNVFLDSQLKRKTFESPDFEKQMASDLRKINHGLVGNFLLKGRDCNCSSCTVAYEMRRRGYDVIANTTKDGRTIEQMETFFQNGKFDTLLEAYNRPPSQGEVNNAVRTLASQGNGARGIINGSYGILGGGHSIAYEVHDGKVRFVDPQAGHEYRNAYAAIGKMRVAAVLRTDQLAFTNRAAETVRNNTLVDNLNEAPSDVALYLARSMAVWGTFGLSAAAQKMQEKEEANEKKEIKSRRRQGSGKKKVS